jgi:hypothetical protein
MITKGEALPHLTKCVVSSTKEHHSFEPRIFWPKPPPPDYSPFIGDATGGIWNRPSTLALDQHDVPRRGYKRLQKLLNKTMVCEEPLRCYHFLR